MNSGDNAKPATSIASSYKATPEESAAASALFARQKTRPPSPRIAVTRKGNNVAIGHDHPDRSVGWLLMVNALGTTDYDFADGLISQLMDVGTKGQNYTEKWPNFMLSIIK